MSAGVSNQSPLQDESMTPSQVGILQLNNMSYKMPPDLCTVLSRNVQSSYFQSQAYSPGSTMSLTVNSGSAYVNLRQSMLVLDVQNLSSGGTASSIGWFGLNGGSAASLVNRIQIISRSGQIIERIDNVNQLAACKVNYAYSQSWRNTVGSLMGIGTAAQVGWVSSSDTTKPQGGATIRFVVPLYTISTFCESLDSLCPSQLLAGSRFELLLENPAVAMMDTSTGGAKVLNYQVVACRIDFESYLLTDSVSRVLSQISASSGLEVVSATTQDTQGQRLSAAGGSQVVVDVARSCSRALSVIYKERLSGPSTLTPAGNLFDYMASAPIGHFTNVDYINTPKEWQVRAGQLYFPQSSIRGGVTLASSNGPGSAEDELYAQTLRAFQKLNSGGLGQMASANSSLFAFRGLSDATQTNGTGSGGTACFALDLQRSAILTSGVPLSNSRQLTIQYSTNVGTTYPNYLIDIFLTYQILVRVYLSQAVIEV